MSAILLLVGNHIVVGTPPEKFWMTDLAPGKEVPGHLVEIYFRYIRNDDVARTRHEKSGSFLFLGSD